MKKLMHNVLLSFIAVVILLATLNYDRPFAVTPTESETNTATASEIMNCVRAPRGFNDIEAVNKFALENYLIEDTENMGEVITIGELARLLHTCDLYCPLPEGFYDKVKAEDVDISVIPKDSDYTLDLLFCLNRGYLINKQVKSPDSTITLNELTRITYRMGMNSLPYTPPTENEIDWTLDAIKEVSRSDSECRIAKVTFLYKYNLIPFTYAGDFPLDKKVTKQDAINYLISFIDALDFYSIDTDNPNKGCDSCEDAALVLRREKYNEN